VIRSAAPGRSAWRLAWRAAARERAAQHLADTISPVPKRNLKRGLRLLEIGALEGDDVYVELLARGPTQVGRNRHGKHDGQKL
jgi:hypothetical protein